MAFENGTAFIEKVKTDRKRPVKIQKGIKKDRKQIRTKGEALHGE